MHKCRELLNSCLPSTQSNIPPVFFNFSEESGWTEVAKWPTLFQHQRLTPKLVKHRFALTIHIRNNLGVRTRVVQHFNSCSVLLYQKTSNGWPWDLGSLRESYLLYNMDGGLTMTTLPRPRLYSMQLTGARSNKYYSLWNIIPSSSPSYIRWQDIQVFVSRHKSKGSL